MQTDRVVKKYLNQYAEPEVNSLERLLDNSPERLLEKKFDYCLVIPAYQETWLQLQKVWAETNENLLIVLVANSPTRNESVTSALLEEIRQSSTIIQTEDNLTFLKTTDKYPILVVDRCLEPIPQKEGVGRARKIGADIVLALITRGIVTHPWIFNTDADVRLPATYFESLEGYDDEDSAAGIYPYSHFVDEGSSVQTRNALYLYEISLHYYVAGLTYASSPYAFPSIGSTIAINSLHYAKVRGFPARNAGEDFYLLNKLAKTGTIHRLSQPIIQISGRLSGRVPFGTGIGISKFTDQLESGEPCLFYNPKVFINLKRFLSLLGSSPSSPHLEQHFDLPGISDWCREINLYPLIKSKQGQKPAVFDKFINDWMDGFKTLKFVHFMRDNFHESLPLSGIFDGTVLPRIADTSSKPLSEILGFVRNVYPTSLTTLPVNGNHLKRNRE